MKGIEQSIRSTETEYVINLFTTLGKNEQVLTDICLGKHADGVILLSIIALIALCIARTIKNHR